MALQITPQVFSEPLGVPMKHFINSLLDFLLIQ